MEQPGGRAPPNRQGESRGSAKLVRESRKSEKKHWAGGPPLGKSSTIIPIIEARQSLGGRLEAR